jgi:uncharacterized protein
MNGAGTALPWARFRNVRAPGDRRGEGARAIRAGLAIALVLPLHGCKFEPTGLAGTPGEPDASQLPDAAPPPGDAAADAAMTPDSETPEAPVHLLLSEVKTQPNDQEFIEVFNPLGTDEPLDDYYLSDDPAYALLPGTGDAAVGGGDAVLRFPAGSTVAAGQAIVVALDEDGFRAAFDRDPDYALVPSSNPVADVMLRVADAPRLMDITDTAEPIILFRWDGMSDLVTDIDMVFVGNDAPAPGTEGALPDKSAVEVDGPDPDDRASSYVPDGAQMTAMLFRATNGGSYQRIALESGHEPRAGGNGPDGHDESSEDTSATWGQADAPPTPGAVTTALRAQRGR